jgi:hypothetical protein
MIVRLARSKQLPSVSKGMLRLVLLVGGVKLRLRIMNTAPDLLRFWGAALAGARDLRLDLHGAGEHVQQLAAGAAGGDEDSLHTRTFPEVTQLCLRVCLHPC